MFSKELNKRIKIIILIVSFLFILVILKVGYIQIVEYKKLNSKATSLWSRNLPIEASRGLIYDANNLIIADNITTTSLVIIPNQIKDKESVAKDLSKILNVNYDEMYKHVSKKTSIERVHPEGRNLDFELEVLKEHEPNLYKAVCNVFKDSYEYTRQYRQFCKEMNRKTKDYCQMAIDDFIN